MRFEPTELTEVELALQREVREFLAAELPRGSSTPGLGMNAGRDPAFSRRLAQRGWVGMALPRRYGGGDRSAVERFVVVEELLRWGAPVGHHWVADRQTGPVINRFGTEAQKERFLPPICRGELSFSIGMSEPDSGSDLASVQTRATRVEGGWLLGGTKIWTSGAHVNDWFIVLCRTSDEPDRHQGLSQLLVDLRSKGLRVNPIRFLDGTEHFNEVVLSDVFVPDDLVLGEVGQGWAQNTSELAHERGGPTAGCPRTWSWSSSCESARARRWTRARRRCWAMRPRAGGACASCRSRWRGRSTAGRRPARSRRW